MDLVIFTAQGSPYQWAGIGWMKREGDFTYIYGGAIFETLGDTLSTLQRGPKPTTKLFPTTRKEQWLTLHIQRVIFADVKGWAELVPRPDVSKCD